MAWHVSKSGRKVKQITAKIPLGKRMTEPDEIAAMGSVSHVGAGQSRNWTARDIDGGYVHLDRL